MKAHAGRSRGFAALIAAMACVTSMIVATAAAAQTTDLTPPVGNVEVASWHGVGVQIYTSVSNGNGGFKWQFFAPEATLFNGGGQVVGHHFATPGGPAWQSNNGSEVVGKKIKQRPSSLPGTIDELLLQGVDWAGNGMFSSVTFLQRLDTRGGAAPAELPTAEGQTVRVPYSATYVFFEQASE